MAENSIVKDFMELFSKDSSLQAAYAEAEAAYPGSLEIREAVVEDVLLPLARRAGFVFTVEDLRNYEQASISGTTGTKNSLPAYRMTNPFISFWSMAGRMMARYSLPATPETGRRRVPA